MEWSDFTDEVPPLTQERWRITEEVKKIGSNNIPNVGDVRTVRVMLPFEEEIGSEFYMDYSLYLLILTVLKQQISLKIRLS